METIINYFNAQCINYYLLLKHQIVKVILFIKAYVQNVKILFVISVHDMVVIHMAVEIVV